MTNWLAKRIYNYLHKEFYTPTRLKNRDVLRQGATCEREVAERMRKQQESEALVVHKQRERQIVEQRERLRKLEDGTGVPPGVNSGPTGNQTP